MVISSAVPRGVPAVPRQGATVEGVLNLFYSQQNWLGMKQKGGARKIHARRRAQL